jgi:hypothetical protein
MLLDVEDDLWLRALATRAFCTITDLLALGTALGRRIGVGLPMKTSMKMATTATRMLPNAKMGLFRIPNAIEINLLAIIVMARKTSFNPSRNLAKNRWWLLFSNRLPMPCHPLDPAVERLYF